MQSFQKSLKIQSGTGVHVMFIFFQMLVRNVIKNSSRRFSMLCSPRQQHDEFTKAKEEDSAKSKEKTRRLDRDNEVRTKILDQALTFVPQSGWSKESLKLGAEAAGYPSVTASIAPNGPVDLVHHHYEQSNQRLEAAMASEVNRLKSSEFLRKYSETRLRMNIPYLGYWADGLGLMALPQNNFKSLQFGLSLVDSMWHHAGDKATDTSWYTKRLTLLGVIKTTELAMMQDKSEDFKDTWAFLDRRFADLNDLGGLLSKGPEDVGKVIESLAVTAKILLGLPR